MPAITPGAGVGIPDPLTRPLLPDRVAYLLVHYTGASTPYGTVSDSAAAVAIARFGIQVGKPNEYSYFIGNQGTIYENAGRHVAAHCLNFNPKSYGVLLMLGVGEDPSPAMIDSFRWLVKHLQSTGQLAASPIIKPHHWARDTSCAGGHVCTNIGIPSHAPTGQGTEGDVLPALLVPWIDPATPPTTTPDPIPPIETDDDMLKFLEADGRPVVLVVGATAKALKNPDERTAVIAIYGDVPTQHVDVTTFDNAFAALTRV